MDEFDYDADDRPKGEDTSYRPICALAIVALGFALLSLTAWLTMVMWCVALFAVVLAIVSLRRITRSDPPMLGRKVALLALFISLVCTVGPITDVYTNRFLVRSEAQTFAKYWFDMQLNRNVKVAQLLVVPPMMAPSSPDEARYDSKQDMAARMREYYRNRPEVRALTALSGKAQVRYYDTESQSRADGNDYISQVYAVTYDKKGTKTTFFVRLDMERAVPADNPVGLWRITKLRGGIRPLALGGRGDEA